MDGLPGKKMYWGFLRFLIDWGWWWTLGMGVFGFLFLIAVGVCAALDIAFLSDATLRNFSMGFKGFSLDLLTHPFRPLVYAALFGLAAFLYGCVLFFVYQLRQILRSMDGGSPFTVDNARRLRRMGYTVFVAALAQTPPIFWGLNHLVNGRTEASLFIGPSSLDFGGPLLFGLVLLALAEVFQYGVGLQGDRDLTI
jgi:hypothetical protein